jgi:adenosine deaminase
MPSLTSLPKAELHIHVEGSVRVSTLRELAAREGLPLPPALREDDRWLFAGSMDFIENYIATCSLLTRLDDFRRVATEFCADLAATGVRYAEAVFSPGNHARRFDDDWFGPIEAVLDGPPASGTTASSCACVPTSFATWGSTTPSAPSRWRSATRARAWSR